MHKIFGPAQNILGLVEGQGISLITFDHFQNVTTTGHVVPAKIHARKKKVTVTPTPIASMV